MGRAGGISGTLILSALTANLDVHNHVPATQAPDAGLAELAGVKVAEFGRLAGPGASG